MHIKTQILTTASKVLIKKKSEASELKFFIISSGRSGTTLLRKLLVKGGEIYIPPESNDWIPKFAVIFTKKYFASWHKKVALCLDILDKDPDFKYWDINLKNVREILLKLDPESQNFYGLINFLYRYNAPPNTPVLGDKTPYLILELPWIKALFPQAKFIHLIRDSKDVVSSRMKNFNESIEQATNRWVWAMIETDKHFHKNQKNFIEIKYEDLTHSPQKTLQDLTHFLGVKYSPEMLAHEDLELGDTHLEHHQETHNPIHQSAVKKWKSVLTPDEVKYIDNRTQKWMKIKGYD